jgi:hypothetical protein
MSTFGILFAFLHDVAPLWLRHSARPQGACAMAKTESSVADALRLAHQALMDDLRQLEEAAGLHADKGLHELRARTETTRTHIAEHFRCEEQDGYMAALRKREPRLEHVIQQLAQEHRELLQDLDAVAQDAQAATNLSTTMRGKLKTWVKRVRQHEAHENDLVQNAYNLDLAAED